MAVIYIDQTGFQAGRKGEITVPNETGNYNISIPPCLGYSDRCGTYPVEDPRAWAYTIHITVNCTVRVTRNDDSSLSVKVDAFTSWRVTRQQGSTPSGLAVVPGDYLFYSSLNNALVYEYKGPSTSGQGTTSWSGNGGTSTLDLGTIKPQETSGKKEYAHSSNAVNGLVAQANISIKNDLPPDYRPGERQIGGSWASLNRSGGVCERSGGGWIEMRTSPGTGDPPEVCYGSWQNQKKYE